VLFSLRADFMDATPTTSTSAAPPAALAERRQHTRIGILWMATLRSATGFIECIVLDISRGGAKLAFNGPASLPATPVALVLEGVGTFRAVAAWQRQTFAGIRFLDPPDEIARAFADLLTL
jgi:hypothetical protein